MFNAVSQAWCFLGGGVIGRVRAGRQALIWQTAVGVAGLTGELCGQYPVLDTSAPCLSRRSERQEQEGRRLPAHPLIELKVG
jgi:hypothetical protein